MNEQGLSGLRAASKTLRRELKRRVNRVQGCRLDESTVILIEIPGTAYHATGFCMQRNGKPIFVAEFGYGHAEFPHVYVSAELDPRDPRRNAGLILTAFAKLSQSIKTDPRFQRGKIIRLSGLNGAS